VKEETGLENIKFTGPLMITYHTYREGTRFILKESHWYRMKAKSGQFLVPQAEEDIHEIKWVTPEELDSYLSNTFPSIVDVLQTGLPV
jgi:hypothetical protein